MRIIQIFICLISLCLMTYAGYSYNAVTMDVTSTCQNYSFDSGLTSWQALTTAGFTSVDSSTIYHGASVVFLKANYASSASAYEAAVSPIISRGYVRYSPRDGLLVKVRFMGMDTMSACTITGMFSVELKGGLSIYQYRGND